MSIAEKVRFTISVEPEVYEAFADLAHQSGVSLSRCIGDWLRDTSEAAQMTTLKVIEARQSVDQAWRSLKLAEARSMPELLATLDRTAYGRSRELLGLSEKGGPVGGRAAPGGRSARPVPPSSNTGGKSPGKTRRAP